MSALEIIMLVLGVICFGASYLLTSDDAAPVNNKKKSRYDGELSREQVNNIREKVDEVVNSQMSLLEETTEAALDKISNTKILEMNEYAESVLNEINKNHNETVFMYDMLSDKSTDIKNLSKDINSIRNEIDAVKASMSTDVESLESLLRESEKAIKEIDIAIKAAYKSRSNNDSISTTHINEKKNIPVENRKPVALKEPVDIQDSSNTEMSKNDKILMMHKAGKSTLEIAKTLNLGMGEVKLVIDLFKSNRQ